MQNDKTTLGNTHASGMGLRRGVEFWLGEGRGCDVHGRIFLEFAGSWEEVGGLERASLMSSYFDVCVGGLLLFVVSLIGS